MQHGIFARRTENLTSSFIRDILAVTQRPEIISFAGGLPDTGHFPVEALRQATRNIQEKYGPSLYQYNRTQGLPELRELIGDALNSHPWPAENILITTGSQQGLDLAIRCLFDPGDRVVVETPSYLGALQSLQANEISLTGIPQQGHGPDLDTLEQELSAGGIKGIYTVPDFQNPTGLCYTLTHRERLVELARKYQIWIIEDAPYSELRYDGKTLPSLQSLCPERVIRLGSFSKIIAPALRMGWVSAPTGVIRVMERMKQVTDLHSSSFDQYLILEFLQGGALPPHIERLRSLYGSRRDAMCRALDGQLKGKVKYTRPEGGMFLWLELAEEIDSMGLFNRAIEQGVAFVPGQAFHSQGKGKNFLRLNFSSSAEAEIEEGINRLAGLL